MPQLFHVLQCYKCSVFQVHQTKNSNTWECKLCGEKQSVKRFYGLGTAKECRFHVQKLNSMRGEIDGLKNNIAQESDNTKHKETVTEPVKTNYIPVKNSKWSSYLEESDNSKYEETVAKPMKINYTPVKNCKVSHHLEEKDNNKHETTVIELTKYLKEKETLEENPNKRLSDAEVVLEIPKKRRRRNVNTKKNPNITTANQEHTEETYESGFAWSVIAQNDSTSVGSIQSNAQQPSPNYSANLVPERQLMNKTKQENKFVAPKIPENSKWAQFIEKPDDDEQAAYITPSKSLESSQHDLFSWCDEEDLDFILDI